MWHNFFVTQLYSDTSFLWDNFIVTKLYCGIGQRMFVCFLAQLVADPPPANSTKDTDTHPLGGICHTVVNLVFGRIDKFTKI